MVAGPLLTDELLLPDLPARSQHPLDSSRVLLGLTALSQQAEAAASQVSGAEMLDGVISKGVLRSLLSALHFRDVSTVRHSRRAAVIAVGIAQYLGWEGRDLRLLEVSALLHDIGKIGVPDNILFKPGILSSDEAELMALHSNIAIDVLQACRADRDVLRIVTESSNHYKGELEGSRRLGGEVHQGARILAVADAYDSLATEQVYRVSKPHSEIMTILNASAGTQFDGNILAALERWVVREGMPSVYENPDCDHRPHTLGPAHLEDALEASSLCHIFSYLYMLESLYDGFFLIDSDLRFVVWNGGAEQLLGFPSHQMLSQVWTSRVLEHADKFGNPLPDQELPLHQVVRTGKALSTELQIRHWDGRWVPVESHAVPLLDQDRRLQGIAHILRDTTRNLRRPKEFKELKLAASRDALTSVANRGELETQLAVMIADCLQSHAPKPFSVMFLDVDHFKSINDAYGHAVGDQVLVDIARLLQHETYSGEIVGRYGGEEFVILCPETPLSHAVNRAERLRLAISRAKITGLTDCRVTASFGVTEAEFGDSVESIFRRADKALYAAKEQGRDRTCSLTNAQLLEPVDAAKSQRETRSEPYLLSATFSACIAADLVVYKMGGFVNEHRAKLVEVTPKRAVVRIGKKSTLGFWGNKDDRRPVEIQIEFGEQRVATPRPRRGASALVDISVRIRPVGRAKSRDVFEARARDVLHSLRSYFAGE